MGFDLKQYIQNAPVDPGVYQMCDLHERVLYIGKAKNLRNRLSAYLHPDNTRIQNLVHKIHNVVVTICSTEEEAQFLEHRMIQNIQPPFNILLKDNKGYPFIVLTSEPYPKIHIERRLKKISDDAQGPYPTLELAKYMLDILVKTFQIRTCSDYVFKTRHRPCLQHQMKRCSAPCVYQTLKDRQDYTQQVAQARAFLKDGINEQITQLEDHMQVASQSEDFERAATFRDYIKNLRTIQRQSHTGSTQNERIDIIAYQGASLAHHFMIFDGQIQLSQSLKISNPLKCSLEQALEPLLYQLYEKLDPKWAPSLVLGAIAAPMHMSIHGYGLTIRAPQGERETQWMQTALESLTHNVLAAPNQKSEAEYESAFQSLEHLFLQSDWQAIECVDVGHHHGQHVVGAVCRFDRKGPVRKEYRKYRLARDQICQNNDPLSIGQTLERHFKQRKVSYEYPNLLIVDGGKAQLRAASEAIQSCDRPPMIVMSMTKDRSRKNGLETFGIYDAQGTFQDLDLTQLDCGKRLLQEIRDEAHRVAKQFHYHLVKKDCLRNGLDDFKGLGSAKKLHLLQTFGGWQGLKQVELQQLLSIEGIGKILALRLLEYLQKRP